MLQEGDKVKFDLSQLIGFPEWWLNYESDNVGTVVEAEHNGWVTVQWSKGRWDEPEKPRTVEIAELVMKVEDANANI